MPPTPEELLLINGQKVSAVIRGETYSVKVRGWRENRYIITDVPQIQGEEVRVAPQTGCNVRFVKDGVVMLFDTYVEYYYSQASSFMAIEYPRKFEKIKLRKHDRYRANAPAKFSQMSAGATTNGNGIIRDLSMEGGLLCHKIPLIKGNKAKMSFSLGEIKVDEIDVLVQNIRKNPKSQSEPLVTGIKFLKPPEAVLDFLRQFIETRVTDRRAEKRSR
jgi:hypothetical protein